MKVRILNWVIIVDILSFVLVLSIILIPYTAARVIFGLPFLLFFPGYTLVSAVFAGRHMDWVERFALSVGMSVAVVGMIGFGLNYTSWGISLDPVLYCIAAFILVTSAVALIRRAGSQSGRFSTQVSIRLPGWGGTPLGKALTIAVVVAMFGALSVLGYTVASPKIGEKFTEFYILGINGRAQDYPTEFTLEDQKVTAVAYGNTSVATAAAFGTVTVGIVNHEQHSVVYSFRLTIDGEPANIDFDGKSISSVDNIELGQGDKWENAIGIIPTHAGSNQKVEILLFSGSETAPENSLHLWIDVIGAN